MPVFYNKAMITSSNLARANLQNVLDTSFYIYLNPELEHVHSITSVEDAYMFYLKNRVPYDTSNLVTNPAHVPDRNEFLRNFDHTVYYTMYSSNINEDDYITDAVRESISNDVERLSVIHYHRVGRGDYNYRFTSVDSNFNPYMYKVMHGITREMTLPEVYNDYLVRKYVDLESVVIGDMQELTYTIASNVTANIDNLVIRKNLIVKETATIEKNAYIKSHLHLARDAILEIEGGTLAISDNFGTTISSQDIFVTSNLTLGESSMKYVNAATAPGDNPGLILDRVDMVVNSNLFVKQNGVFEKSILIGDNLFYEDAYSMQCDKKIRVEGTDVLSDRRLKRNLVAVDTTKCLEDTMRLAVKRFDLTKHGNTTPPVTGLVAQDVELVLPDTVSAIKGAVPLPVAVTGVTKSPSVLTIQEGVDDEKDLARMGIDQGTSIQVKRVSTSHVHKYVVEKVAFPNIVLSGTVDLKTNETYNIEDVMLDNLRSIDYTQLFCTLLGAVQEIAKEQARLSSNIYHQSTRETRPPDL